MNPQDLIMAVEEKRLARIAELGSDHCRVCTYDNVSKLVKHHPETEAANPDYWEVWCVYCHEAYDPWSGAARTRGSRPSAYDRLQRMIAGAQASRVAELFELEAILREVEGERRKST